MSDNDDDFMCDDDEDYGLVRISPINLLRALFLKPGIYFVCGFYFRNTQRTATRSRT